ncbi:hypothetical protein CMV_026009 [Castanea mollissima]|uniref:Uncharacterized protein n=1 Tax=Castanea mollissima TaxID=60419 RepID=A0A8J4QD71_9ROSI|nr:hypothetical protein CMV_026009 [Castanea mollissima]
MSNSGGIIGRGPTRRGTMRFWRSREACLFGTRKKSSCKFSRLTRLSSSSVRLVAAKPLRSREQTRAISSAMRSYKFGKLELGLM